MMKLGLAVAVSIACVAGCSVSADRDDVSVKPDVNGAAPEAQKPGGAKHRLVVFRGDTSPSDAEKRIVKAGGKVVKLLDAVGVAVVVGDAAFDAAIARDGTVLSVGDEMRWSNPSSQVQLQFPDQIGWPLQWDIRRVNAPAAWNNVSAEQQAGVTVAVIDAGVMWDHPDLGNVVDAVTTSLCFDPVNDHGPGYPKYTQTFNLSTFTCDPGETTYEFHGTHVAGTIAAQTGGGFVVGVAPGAHLAAYKVFDRFNVPDPNTGAPFTLSAWDGAMYAAVIDAANKHYGVINMSLGGRIDRSDRQQNASWLAWNRVARYATNHGTLIVAAAGNDATSSNGTTAFIPADLPNVLSVSATGTSTAFPEIWEYAGSELDAAPGSDVLAFYSNTGASVDVSAPGGDCGPGFPASCNPLHLILSSVITPDGQADWAWAAGTSMASPHVAGVAALVRAKHPELGPLDVRSRIKDTAQPMANRLGFGAGIADANAATLQ